MSKNSKNYEHKSQFKVETFHRMEFSIDTIKQDVMSKTRGCEHNLSPAIFIGNQIIREQFPLRFVQILINLAREISRIFDKKRVKLSPYKE